MRLYALVEAGDPEAIDVFLCEEDAQRALEDCLHDSRAFSRARALDGFVKPKTRGLQNRRPGVRVPPPLLDVRRADCRARC
jgi:hypothetical protein